MLSKRFKTVSYFCMLRVAPATAKTPTIIFAINIPSTHIYTIIYVIFHSAGLKVQKLQIMVDPEFIEVCNVLR